MKTIRPTLLCLGLLGPTFAQAAGWLTTQISYQPGWSISQVSGLNNLGQVIGVMQPSSPPPFPGIYETVEMGFVTGTGGRSVQAIDPAYTPYIEYCHGCGTVFTPRAINDAGQIVVTTFSSWSADSSLLLASPSGWTTLPSPSASLWVYGSTIALNSSGQVAGTFASPTPASFVTDANGTNSHEPSMLDNSYLSTVTGINDHGQLLLTGVPAGSTEARTFVSGPNANGVAFEVGSFGYDSYAKGLNNSAQIFGSYRSGPGGEFRAFVTGAEGAGFYDIGSLGSNTSAFAINDNGFVVGQSGGRAYLYSQADGIIDLNQFITLASGEQLTAAADINDRGQIVALSNLGKLYLLSPVPEPAAYLMFLGGLALVYWRRRRTVSRETAVMA